MLWPGLVSVTFRKLSPPEIVRACVAARLEGIEWGGDIHVPHGDLAAARQVAALTLEAGLRIAAYGSYYRLGEAPDSFDRVLATAVALQAPIIRVWAGRMGSNEATPELRARVVDDARRVAELASQAGLRVTSEWHGGTLTDTRESAAAFLAAVQHDNFRTYWQPRGHLPFSDCLRDLEAALPRLAGLHVFQWDPRTKARLPLQDGDAVWPSYLAKAAQAGNMFALLEFVRNDDPAQLAKDAAVLRAWLAAGT